MARRRLPPHQVALNATETVAGLRQVHQDLLQVRLSAGTLMQILDTLQSTRVDAFVDDTQLKHCQTDCFTTASFLLRVGEMAKGLATEVGAPRFLPTPRARRQVDIHRELSREVRSLNTALAGLKSTQLVAFERQNVKNMDANHDLFISHASEDKDDFVRPLAESLISYGLRVWYDEFSLTLGDSLTRSIDKGLATSRYGLVILSPAFFAKNWTKYELGGLIMREMQGNKVVLPIWHRITRDEVLAHSPSLADKVALSSASASISEMSARIAETVRDA